MTFPTKADIEFFKEAKRIQELWEPKVGDFCAIDKDILLITEPYGYGWLLRTASRSRVQRQFAWEPKRDSPPIFLPRQGQLQEMLEEKGCKRICLRRSFFEQKTCGGEPEWAVDLRDSPYPQTFFGPTPSIALGKCLLEVLKGGE